MEIIVIVIIHVIMLILSAFFLYLIANGIFFLLNTVLLKFWKNVQHFKFLIKSYSKKKITLMNRVLKRRKKMPLVAERMLTR